MAVVPTCHPERKHLARGLCNTCYYRLRYRKEPEYRERMLEKSRAEWRATKADPAAYAAKLEYNRNRPEHRARRKV